MQHPYERIERAIAYLRSNVQRQPQLADVAAAVGLSAFHFQRLFTAWAGISPKRYLAALTVDNGKDLLLTSTSVLDTAQTLGLSGPSRLHDQFVALEAVSPGEFKAGGAGLDIEYGFHSTPLGSVLVAQTRRGLCLLSFVEANGPEAELARLQRLYPRAHLLEAPAATAPSVRRIFGTGDEKRISLTVAGTNLQVQVWRALLRIPAGTVISYQELARQVDRPRAVRAVASAVAANPVNFLIPCHRVLRADGELGGFRGGPELKARLLTGERGRQHP